ncbi:unnamed protein product [Rotaria sordida]|uniref:Uncharacterized protein n=1 Tax=Rotaria sordida TaxID=392033 RepID=A0A815ZC51_9BILA|nr:unnamed protein product [Rotaria sordida]
MFPESKHAISSFPFFNDDDELAMAMKYYLQMDVDMFYMKISPLITIEYNFSDQDLFFQNEYQQPVVSYTLQHCKQINCYLCQLSSFLSGSMIQFDSYMKHCFANQYQSILNGPATCQTMNIIYVFTCPCKKYEFIGSTSQGVVDVIHYYRRSLNVYLHEYFFGLYNQTSATTTSSSSSSSSSLSNTKLFSSVCDQLLYEHAIKCPAIWQVFLQYNPDYTCFIPSFILQKPIYGNLITMDNQLKMSKSSNEISNLNETISLTTTTIVMKSEQQQQQQQQHEKQHEFYQQCSLKQKVTLHTPDLYRFSLIAILPESASSLVRTLIQGLFILHTEAKLNE